MPLSILALNVSAPPRDRATRLLEWLWGRDEEVLVLTEVAAGAGSALVGQVCRAAGYAVLGTAGDGERLGTLVVGRGVALEPAGEVPSDLAGRVVSCRIDLDGSPLDLLGVYGRASDPVRYASREQRERKRRWLAGLQDWLPLWRAAGPGEAGAALVAGDLNVVDPLDDLPYVLAEERDFYAWATGDLGLADAYRLRHPDGAEVSWVDHSGAGCRYDHALVSRSLAEQVTSCELVHEPRLDGLSDHSALTLTLR